MAKKSYKGGAIDKHHNKMAKKGHMIPPKKDPLIPKGCDKYGHFGEDYSFGGTQGGGDSGPASPSAGSSDMSNIDGGY